LFVELMAPNSGNGVSNVRRDMVPPAPVYKAPPLVQVLPETVLQNGLLTVPPNRELLSAIACVTELSVFRYLVGTALMLRVISMLVPWSPTYDPSITQPPQSSRCTPNDQRNCFATFGFWLKKLMAWPKPVCLPKLFPLTAVIPLTAQAAGFDRQNGSEIEYGSGAPFGPVVSGWVVV